MPRGWVMGRVGAHFDQQNPLDQRPWGLGTVAQLPHQEYQVELTGVQRSSRLPGPVRRALDVLEASVLARAAARVKTAALGNHGTRIHAQHAEIAPGGEAS